MALRNPFERFNSDASPNDATPDGAPLGGTRAEAMQRLQIGLFGIGAMLLLVGLANVIGTQANITQESAVPEAAPTTEPTAAAQQSDPMADAGIVPDIPANPSPTPTEGVAQPAQPGQAQPVDDTRP